VARERLEGVALSDSGYDAWTATGGDTEPLPLSLGGTGSADSYPPGENPRPVAVTSVTPSEPLVMRDFPRATVPWGRQTVLNR